MSAPASTCATADAACVDAPREISTGVVSGTQSSITQPVLGHLADRSPLRWMAWLGLLATAIGAAGIGIAPNYWALLLFLIVGALGTSAFHPVATATISDIAGARRGQMMSVYITAGNLGLALRVLRRGLAAAMIDGQALPAQLTDARANDPAVAELRNRIDFSEDPSLSRRAAVVTLELNDGTTYTETVPHPTGTPENPQSDTMVQEKFKGLATAVLGAEKTAKAHSALWNVDKLSDVKELMPLLVK